MRISNFKKSAIIGLGLSCGVGAGPITTTYNNEMSLLPEKNFTRENVKVSPLVTRNLKEDEIELCNRAVNFISVKKYLTEEKSLEWQSRCAIGDAKVDCENKTVYFIDDVGYKNYLNNSHYVVNGSSYCNLIEERNFKIGLGITGVIGVTFASATVLAIVYACYGKQNQNKN